MTFQKPSRTYSKNTTGFSLLMMSIDGTTGVKRDECNGDIDKATDGCALVAMDLFATNFRARFCTSVVGRRRANDRDRE